MLTAYWAALRAAWPTMAAWATFALVVGLAARHVAPIKRLTAGRFRVVFALFVIGMGVWLAWRERSLFDDSFITFRYIQNGLAGHGLVFNIGERVEGYTNFMWLVVIAALTWATGVSIPLVALFAGLLVFAANLATVIAIGRRLCSDDRSAAHLPLAALWVGCQNVFHVYGTSGMETMFASWMVNLAVLSRLALAGRAAIGAAGAFLILATLTRPDHSLFYAVMAAVLAAERVPVLRRALRQKRLAPAVKTAAVDAAAYSASAVVYGAYLLWKLHYYGSIVPNTFFAKSAELTYWTQGLIYAASYALSSHMIVVLPIFTIWLFGWDRHRWFKGFAGAAVVVVVLYVVRLGGDQMFGRFFQSLVPLVLLGVEQMIHHVAVAGGRLPSRRAVAAAVVLAATLFGLPMVKPAEGTWYIFEPNRLFRVTNLSPMRIQQEGSTYDRVEEATRFARAFADKGLAPSVADGGIGIFGYFSKLPLIDTNGLTDAYVGRLPLAVRGKPGHEKEPGEAYLNARGVLIARAERRKQTRAYASFHIGGHRVPRHVFYRWDTPFMTELRKRSPEVSFVDFPAWYDEHWKAVYAHSPARVARRLAEYDHYYFNDNPDPERRDRLVSRFLWMRDFEHVSDLGDLRVKKGAAPQFLCPVEDGAWRIAGYQGRCLIATGLKGKGRWVLPDFTIDGDTVALRIGSAHGRKGVRADLVIDGKPVRGRRAEGAELLQTVLWNVSEFRGRTAHIRLTDNAADDRLYVDDLWEARRAAPPLAAPTL